MTISTASGVQTSGTVYLNGVAVGDLNISSPIEVIEGDVLQFAISVTDNGWTDSFWRRAGYTTYPLCSPMSYDLYVTGLRTSGSGGATIYEDTRSIGNFCKDSTTSFRTNYEVRQYKTSYYTYNPAYLTIDINVTPSTVPVRIASFRLDLSYQQIARFTIDDRP